MSLHISHTVLPLILMLLQTSGQLGAQVTAPEIKTLSAGTFSVKAPAPWADSALVEEVPSHPLYSAVDWKSFQENARYTLKPGYENRPQHWAIRFPALVIKGQSFDKQNAGSDSVAPQILIHQADGWATILETGAADSAKAAETRRKFRQSLIAMDSGLPNSITPAFVDGGLSFLALKKKVRFQGGYGYRLMCQWTIEADLVRRGMLHYLFVGLSDDDSCQIIATFPLDCPGLPSDALEAEHLGYSAQRYEELTRNFEAYSTAAENWIKQHEKDFTPSLDALDRLIESLSADTWR
ncbi:hypothetical protein EI77_03724 [Prosthecobacter fusiformis]|uniref:Uncharacterized protein n=1 Tax=Prosthecobacter fusiformis TaxID=48464 RepID=A0A4R7RNM7_9BACT|nr:hypothetical protein [Prosthecobacter fusiformis]TDU66629.1 hypothetical protein EI77_03724 [Prosthecobacter fusiformis]